MLPNGSIIYYESFKYEENADLRDFVDSSKGIEFLEHIWQPVILVLGWDGSMLSAIHKHYKKKIPFLGINFWKTGFLMNEKKVLNENRFVNRIFPLISAELYIWDKIKKQFIALNEIDIRSARGRVLQLDIKISDSATLSLLWDGTIISTPAGSTAYNRSLWGPIIPHGIPVFVITPKAPIEPRWQPSVILADDTVLEIHNTGRKNMFHIYGDGKEILSESDENIKLVLKKSDIYAEFLIWKNYESAWSHKVMKEQWFQT